MFLLIRGVPAQEEFKLDQKLFLEEVPPSSIEHQPSPNLEQVPASSIEYQPSPFFEQVPNSSIEHQPSSFLEQVPASSINHQRSSFFEEIGSTEQNSSPFPEHITAGIAQQQPSPLLEQVTEEQSIMLLPEHVADSSLAQQLSFTSENAQASSTEQQQYQIDELNKKPSLTFKNVPVNNFSDVDAISQEDLIENNQVNR